MGTLRLIKNAFVSGIFILLITSSHSRSETGLEGREQVILKGNTARVGVDIAGGSIVDFHLSDQGINPLTWNIPEKGDLKPLAIGHFICFDRWGQPSPQESKNGMPFHGEAATVEWKVLSQPLQKDGIISSEMLCELPIGGLRLKRTLSLYMNVPVLMVREEITNINKLGRVYNIVQHATIGPPFLDETVLVDSNAWKGYMQESPMPTPEEPVIYWPKIVYNGELVDLRRLLNDPKPTVVSFVFENDEDYGWVTACNPAQGLMIGYIWKLSDYPWINFWRNVSDEKPAARGLEFGTTGLHKPFADILAKKEIFGTPLFEYIDAGQTMVKAYVAFLYKIPADYKGVQDILYRDGEIIIKEQGLKAERDITITMQ